jgi:hypothetical protein
MIFGLIWFCKKCPATCASLGGKASAHMEKQLFSQRNNPRLGLILLYWRAPFDKLVDLVRKDATINFYIWPNCLLKILI